MNSKQIMLHTTVVATNWHLCYIFHSGVGVGVRFVWAAWDGETETESECLMSKAWQLAKPNLHLPGWLKHDSEWICKCIYKQLFANNFAIKGDNMSLFCQLVSIAPKNPQKICYCSFEVGMGLRQLKLFIRSAELVL